MDHYQDKPCFYSLACYKLSNFSDMIVTLFVRSFREALNLCKRDDNHQLLESDVRDFHESSRTSHHTRTVVLGRHSSLQKSYFY